VLGTGRGGGGQVGEHSQALGLGEDDAKVASVSLLDADCAKQLNSNHRAPRAP
jgi:hypothetical protein